MRDRIHRHRRSPAARQGSLYIAVLAVATIVSIIGFAALHVARIHVQGAVVDGNRHNARLLAISAIEHAVSEFNTNATWESSYTPDVEYPGTPPTVNGGTFAWKLVALANQQRQLLGIGRSGDAQCVFQVELGLPAHWLQYGMLCGGDIIVGKNNKASDLTVTGAPICSNASFTNVAGTTTADVEAQTINGIVNGTQTVPAAIRALPPADVLFQYYVVHGTSLGTNQIQRGLISPYQNPYGAINPDGIYVIDAGGGTVQIRECRVVGTLVVLNSEHVEIRDQVIWEPARPNFPALLVEGDIRVRMVDGKLDELDEQVNFNPPQTPFLGETDSATDDSYPSAIAGLVYCTGNLSVDGNNNGYSASFHGGIIVNGSCTVEQQAKLSIEYGSASRDDPPPGFRPVPANQIRRGSWRQIPSS